jgi:hypothetical protein
MAAAAGDLLRSPVSVGRPACVEMDVTISNAETEVTVGEIRPSIEFVRHWTEQMLTKRRAVDFCRVAASLCRMA